MASLVPRIDVSGWQPCPELPSPRVDLDFSSTRPTRHYVHISATGARIFKPTPTYPIGFASTSRDAHNKDAVPAHNASPACSRLIDIPESPIPSPSRVPALYSISEPKCKSSQPRTDSEIKGATGKKGEPGHIPRPPNKFILFRQHVIQSLPKGSSMSKSELNNLISTQWQNLQPHQVIHWEEQAQLRKQELLERYPNYVYQPGPRGRARPMHRDRRARPTHRGKLAASVQGQAPSLDNALGSDIREPSSLAPRPKKKPRVEARSRRQTRELLRRYSEPSLPKTGYWSDSRAGNGGAELLNWNVAALSQETSSTLATPQPSPILAPPFQVVASHLQADNDTALANPSFSAPNISYSLHAPFPNFQTSNSSLCATIGSSTIDPPSLQLETCLPPAQYMDNYPQSAPANTSTTNLTESDLSALNSFHYGLQTTSEYDIDPFDFQRSAGISPSGDLGSQEQHQVTNYTLAESSVLDPYNQWSYDQYDQTWMPYNQ